jgi:hypothetical protein
LETKYTVKCFENDDANNSRHYMTRIFKVCIQYCYDRQTEEEDTMMPCHKLMIGSRNIYRVLVGGKLLEKEELGDRAGGEKTLLLQRVSRRSTMRMGRGLSWLRIVSNC